MAPVTRNRRQRRRPSLVFTTIWLACSHLEAFAPVQRFQRPPCRHFAENNGIGVGIDLGTTHSAVAYLKDGVPRIIEIPNNGRTMPSVVSMDDNGSVLVGRPAVAIEAERGAYRNVKRVIGTGGKLDKDISEVVPFLVPSTVGKTFKKDSLENRLHDAEQHPTMLQSISGDSDTLEPAIISSYILHYSYVFECW